VIVVDTSALMAVALAEAEANACIAALEAEDEILISAGTVVEVLIVAARHNVLSGVERLIDELAFEIVPVMPVAARRIAQAYERWGKGIHKAVLNFGDCFAYSLAKERGCRLLYVGNDFSKTDIDSVL
jgi:ribonuclease VapC